MLYSAAYTRLYIPEESRSVNRFLRIIVIFTIFMNTTSPYRVLFVCLGNICRSPAAEIIFNALAGQAGIAGQVQADSCGTASYHTGSKPDARMLDALERAGYRYGGHRARTFRRADFSKFDLIVPQDEYNEQDIRQLARNATDEAKVRGMWQWFSEQEKEHSVPDPYYGGPAGFDAVVALLTRSIQNLVEEIKMQIAD